MSLQKGGVFELFMPRKLFDNKLGQVRLVKAVKSELCSADRQTKD